MSRADHDEPLQWHWLYIPLVAYLVFAVGPSILAPIFFVLSLFVDISSIIGPAQRPASARFYSCRFSRALYFGPSCGCMVALETN